MHGQCPLSPSFIRLLPSYFPAILLLLCCACILPPSHPSSSAVSTTTEHPSFSHSLLRSRQSFLVFILRPLHSFPPFCPPRLDSTKAKNRRPVLCFRPAVPCPSLPYPTPFLTAPRPVSVTASSLRRTTRQRLCLTFVACAVPPGCLLHDVDFLKNQADNRPSRSCISTSTPATQGTRMQMHPQIFPLSQNWSCNKA